MEEITSKLKSNGNLILNGTRVNSPPLRTHHKNSNKEAEEVKSKMVRLKPKFTRMKTYSTLLEIQKNKDIEGKGIKITCSSPEMKNQKIDDEMSSLDDELELSESESLKREIFSLKEELRHSCEYGRKIWSDNRTVVQEKAKLMKTVEDLENKLHEHKQKTINQKMKIENLKSENKDSSEKNKTLQMDFDRILKNNQQLRSKNRKYKKDLSKLKERCEEQKSQVSILNQLVEKSRIEKRKILSWNRLADRCSTNSPESSSHKKMVSRRRMSITMSELSKRKSRKTPPLQKKDPMKTPKKRRSSAAAETPANYKSFKFLTPTKKQFLAKMRNYRFIEFEKSKRGTRKSSPERDDNDDNKAKEVVNKISPTPDIDIDLKKKERMKELEDKCDKMVEEKTKEAFGKERTFLMEERMKLDIERKKFKVEQEEFEMTKKKHLEKMAISMKKTSSVSKIEPLNPSSISSKALDKEKKIIEETKRELTDEKKSIENHKRILEETRHMVNVMLTNHEIAKKKFETKKKRELSNIDKEKSELEEFRITLKVQKRELTQEFLNISKERDMLIQSISDRELVVKNENMKLKLQLKRMKDENRNENQKDIDLMKKLHETIERCEYLQNQLHKRNKRRSKYTKKMKSMKEHFELEREDYQKQIKKIELQLTNLQDVPVPKNENSPTTNQVKINKFDATKILDKLKTIKNNIMNIKLDLYTIKKITNDELEFFQTSFLKCIDDLRSSEERYQRMVDSEITKSGFLFKKYLCYSKRVYVVISTKFWMLTLYSTEKKILALERHCLYKCWVKKHNLLQLVIESQFFRIVLSCENQEERNKWFQFLINLISTYESLQ